MQHLRALFVAINHYPNPAHRLEGCLHDLEQVKTCLEQCCTALGLGFDALVLTDGAATRANVIAGFDHFQSAAPDDPCLFYFAGHGARSAAPEAFWHLEPDKKLDSIVCWDSRTPGGRDLMDKELSYLVWRANQGKALPFVTITDCCHSGSLRDFGEAEVRARRIRETGEALPTEHYLGIADYKQSADGSLRPPMGRRVHLAAARDAETAKEVRVGSAMRGIFSHCLVEALQQAGPFASYSELARRVQARVRGNMADQSPQLETTLAGDKNLAFLSGSPATGQKSFVVSFDKDAGWVVNAGALMGFKAGDGTNGTLLEVPELQRKLAVVEAHPTFSRVSGMTDSDAKRAYPVLVSRRATPKYRVAIAPGSDPAAVAALTERLARKGSDLYALADATTTADFAIHAHDNQLWLTRAQDPLPLAQAVQGHDEPAITNFLHQIEAIASWRQVLDLNNPHTGIPASEIELTLYRVTEAGNTENDAPVTEMDWQAAPVMFPYVQAGKEWRKPAFQLKLRNTSPRTLWFSLLYFGTDFSITNVLLPKQAIEPGQEAWASYVRSGYAYRTIPLQIDAPYLAQGMTALDEYLKVLVCTEELDTDLLCQEGWKPTGGHRTLHLPEQPPQRDWKAVDVWIRILRV